MEQQRDHERLLLILPVHPPAACARHCCHQRVCCAAFCAPGRLDLSVVTAAHSPAIGAGLCFATACDMRIVASNAKIGYTFVQLGLHPGMGATHFVPNVVGWEMAAKMLLTGEVL